MNTMKQLLILSLAIVLAACGSPEDRKAEYFQKAEALFEQGEFEKARLEYKNVLQIDPEDIKAHYKLGLTQENLQEWRSAAGHYNKVLELDPAHTKARIAMGQFYLLARAFDKAEEEAKTALDNDPNNPDALAFMGSVKAQQKEYAVARFNAEKALKIDPNNINALSLMGAVLVSEGKADEAIKTLNEGIKNNPDDTRLRTIVAGIYASQNKLLKAADIIQQLVDQQPDVSSHRIRLATLYTGAKEIDKAESVLRDMVKDLPDDNQAKLLLIKFLADNRDEDTAKQELVNMVKTNPENYPLQFALAKVYEAEANSEEAIKIYEGIITAEEIKPNGLKARNEIAELYARVRDIEKAKILLAEVLAENPNDQQALTLRGKIALAERDPNTAIADFRSAMRDQPNSIPLLRLLARAHAANNELNLSRDMLKRAVNLAPDDFALREDYIRVLAVNNDVDGVVKQLDEVLELEPENLGAMQTLFRVMASQKDWDSANEIVSRIKQAHPDKPIGFHYAGLLKQAQQQIEESIPEFEKAIELAPDAIQPLTQMVKSYLTLDKTDDAISKLKSVIKGNDQNFVAHNLLGEVLLYKGDRKESWKSFDTAMKIKPDWALPYRNKANLYIMNNQEDQAEVVYKKGIKQTDSSIILVTELAKLYEKQGEFDNAISIYEEVLIKEEENALAANNLAMLLMNYRGDKESLKRAAILVEGLKDQNSAAYLDTVGWLYYKQDKIEDAISFLKKAVELSPDAPELRYHLGMAYMKQGDRNKARTELIAATETEATYFGIEEAKAALKQL